MRVNIVSPYESAAMLRMIDPLKELSKLYEVTQSTEVDPTADVNIHMPFHTLAEDKDYGTGKHIAVYTHCNPGAQKLVFNACQRADIVTTMSYTGRQELLDLGVDPRKIHVVYCAADLFTFRKRAVLIVGYPQPNGRKRESLLLDLAWKYDLTPYEFILAGTQWEETAEKLKSLGVSVQHTHADTAELITKLYQYVDVFVATGYVEGGPLPLLEAMANGCIKVLSPRFGYASDLLDDEDLYDGVDELMEKLNEFSEQSMYYHRLARAWSWHDYANEYALLIGRMMNASTEIYPERGMDRYVQLLDIIDKEKPKSICEIGTWNGDNALRMIQAAAKYHPMKRIDYQGFDLFEKQTGEQFVRELSKVGQPENIVQKRLQATGANIELIAGDTLDTIEEMHPADFIFVDGGHSEDTIENDGEVALLHGLTIVFDDYYHAGKPDGMGCNKFIDSLDSDEYTVTPLPVHTRASDGREIGMVKVKHASV